MGENENKTKNTKSNTINIHGDHIRHMTSKAGQRYYVWHEQ